MGAENRNRGEGVGAHREQKGGIEGKERGHSGSREGEIELL